MPQKMAKFIIATAISFVALAASIFEIVAVFKPSASNLVAEPSEANVGRLAAGTQAKRIVILKNVTGVPVTISSITGSCGCVTARAPAAIPPHSSGPLSITFDSTSADGEFIKTVAIETKGSTRPLLVNVRGTAFAEVRVSPDVLDFGYMRFRESRTMKIAISRTDNHALNITGIKPLRGLSFSYEHIAGRDWQIRLTAPTQAREEEMYDDLTVKTDDPYLQEIRFPVHVSLTGRYRINPRQIDLGLINPNSLTESRVRLDGPHASGLRIAYVPFGMNARLHVVSGNVVVMTTEYRPKENVNRIVNSHVVLNTMNDPSQRVEIPVLGAYPIK